MSNESVGMIYEAMDGAHIECSSCKEPYPKKRVYVCLADECIMRAPGQRRQALGGICGCCAFQSHRLHNVVAMSEVATSKELDESNNRVGEYGKKISSLAMGRNPLLSIVRDFEKRIEAPMNGLLRAKRDKPFLRAELAALNRQEEEIMSKTVKFIDFELNSPIYHLLDEFRKKVMNDYAAHMADEGLGRNEICENPQSSSAMTNSASVTEQQREIN